MRLANAAPSKPGNTLSNKHNKFLALSDLMAYLVLCHCRSHWTAHRLLEWDVRDETGARNGAHLTATRKTQGRWNKQLQALASFNTHTRPLRVEELLWYIHTFRHVSNAL